MAKGKGVGDNNHQIMEQVATLAQGERLARLQRTFLVCKS